MSPRHLGLDFDNTIVTYDALFAQLARERDALMPGVAPTKQAIRDSLRRAGREHEWTELQGLAYGERIVDARPAAGVLDFIERSHAAGIELSIVSHKTRTPYAGPAFDLHAAARRWLETHGVLNAERTGLTHERVYFEETKEAKAARIAAIGCTLFIDDLPEFLGAPFFPDPVDRLLYDPAAAHTSELRTFADWQQLDLATLVEPQA